MNDKSERYRYQSYANIALKTALKHNDLLHCSFNDEWKTYHSLQYNKYMDEFRKWMSASREEEEIARRCQFYRL